jgi:CBS domain-containing protein
MSAADAMREGVVTAGAPTPVKEAARLLVERWISGVSVVDEDGHARGKEVSSKKNAATR